MSSAPRVLGAGVVTVAAALAVGWLSQVPYDAVRGSGALIRLAWRTRGTRVEECRRLTAEELERLPVHMRQDEVCEGRILPYRLVVALDGRTVVDDSVRPSGAREDRPLYVHHEVWVEPGTHALAITFSRDTVPADTPDRPDTASTPGASERKRPGEREAAAPPRLSLARRLVLERDHIALVTYDAEQRRLILKGYGAP